MLPPILHTESNQMHEEKLIEICDRNVQIALNGEKKTENY